MRILRFVRRIPIDEKFTECIDNRGVESLTKFKIAVYKAFM